MKGSIKGIVIRGKGRGVGLGFPTANLKLTNGVLPEYGIYAAWVYLNGQKMKGAVSCGPAYTFNDEEAAFEVYILNFKEDLYGKEIEVELVRKIRDMEKFVNQEALGDQIKKDVKRVDEILK